MNFYQVVQDKKKFQLFMNRLEYSLVSRDFFMEYRASDWELLEDVEKAFRMYYIVKNAYGGLFRFNKSGKCNSPIASSPDKKARSFMFRRSPLRAVHERLKGVILHTMDYKQIIQNYDGLDTFFYLDPPYETEYAYNKPFNHHELLEMCRSIKGKFILSLNSDFESLFSEFIIKKASVNYSVTCKKGNNEWGEIIVMNY
jgi:DNA adenine methylase